MSTYFLTGASGAVGSAIVPLLLADPDTSVRVLMRADSDEHLARRMEALYRFWEMAPDAEARCRIRPLRGDATLPGFGLAEGEYAALCADTTNVIHCAASVHMNKPLDEARRSAVGSAEAILALTRQLAERGILRKLEFVSTVGIAGKRPGILPETWIDEPRAFHNTYEQSKAEAEELVRAAVEVEHLPITVHRPSMVIGDSRDGRIIHFQIFYYICEFLSGRKTFGVYPDFGDAQLDIIPVNSVAEAIVAASRDSKTVARIFHLCSGPERSPRLKDLRSTLREAFFAHGQRVAPSLTLPRPWFAALSHIAARVSPVKLRRTLETLPIYLDYLAERQGFNNTHYLAWRDAKSVTMPAVTECLPTVIGAYLDIRYGGSADTTRRKRKPQAT